MEFVQKNFFKNVIRLAPIMPLEDQPEYDLEYSFRTQLCTSVSSNATNATMSSSYEELYDFV